VRQRSETPRGKWLAGWVLASSAILLSQAKESGPGGPEAQKAGRAAVAFAQSIADEGTPEYTAALRNASALAGRLPVDMAASRTLPHSTMVRGLLDLDLRYRQNVAAMDPQERIIGGERVPPGLYPDTVAITGNGGLCTGTIISANAVLTAAHCFCRGVKETVYVGDTIGNATTKVGVSTSSGMVGCTEDLAHGDVAVLFVTRPLTVTPRRFAHESLIASARIGRAVGFGLTENPIAEPLGIKRRVDVPIASTACNGTVTTPNGAEADSTFYKCSPGQELVAGAPSLDKDSCNGDSGGPLFLTASDGNLYLAGATSRATGPPGLRPCGDGGIYVRTDGRLRNWLQGLGVNVTVGPPQ
jgi:hypothetical protein